MSTYAPFMVLGFVLHALKVAAAIAGVLVAVFAFHLFASGGDIARAKRRWRESTEAFGAFMGRVILTVVYVLVFPFGLIARSKDPMRIRGPARWIERRTRDVTIDDLRKMY